MASSCCDISHCFHTMTLDEYWDDYLSEQTGNKVILKKQNEQAENDNQDDRHIEEEISKLEDQHLIYVERQDHQHKKKNGT